MEHLGPIARGTRKFSGVKYHRITGCGDEKQLYDRAKAEKAAANLFAALQEGSVAVRDAVPGQIALVEGFAPGALAAIAAMTVGRSPTARMASSRRGASTARRSRTATS